MYDFLKRKFKEGQIGESEINKAIIKGWITQEQANELLVKKVE